MSSASARSRIETFEAPDSGSNPLVAFSPLAVRVRGGLRFFSEMATILAALEDPPADLAELPAPLLGELEWRRARAS